MNDMLYDIKRNKLIKKLTRNLGKVVEEEEKLVCYVYKRGSRKKCYHEIVCTGIFKRDKIEVEKYDLNKPICYVFEGLDFEDEDVYIHGFENCEIIIRNCNFDSKLVIHTDGKCIIEDSSVKSYGKSISLSGRELIIRDTHIYNEDSNIDSWNNIFLEGTYKLEVVRSNIEAIESDVIIRASKYLEIFSSKIRGYEVNCSAERLLSCTGSWLIADSLLIFKVPNFRGITVMAPNVCCNKMNFKLENKPMILRKVLNPLREKRLKLIEELYKLKNRVVSSNRVEINRYEEKLNNKPIGKILSK